MAGPTVPIVIVPPGVDTAAFRPLAVDERRSARTRFELPEDGDVIVSLSRLVPRKGMDVLIAAVSLLARERPDVVLAIAGTGRDRPRLERLARHCGAPVRFLGWVTDADRALLLAPPTCSPCCAAVGGAGWSRRASGSCSWRPPPVACPRWRATAGGRPRLSSPARRARW